MVGLRDYVAGRSGTVADVVSTLRAALDVSGLRAERVTYETQPLFELGLTQLQINLPVRGDYADLRRFLDALLDGPMFVVLERVSASAPSQNDRSGELLMGVAASVFIDGDGDALPMPPAQADAERQPTGADPLAEANRLVNQLRSLPGIPLPDEDFQLARARLEEETEPVARTSRDLFSFVMPRAPRIDRGVDPEPAEDNFMPEPVLPYELIGVNRTEEGLLATLVDGDLVLVVREQQVLPDGYRVKKIEPMEVTLESGLTTSRLKLRDPKDNDKKAGRKNRRKKKQ